MPDLGVEPVETGGDVARSGTRRAEAFLTAKETHPQLDRTQYHRSMSRSHLSTSQVWTARAMVPNDSNSNALARCCHCLTTASSSFSFKTWSRIWSSVLARTRNGS